MATPKLRFKEFEGSWLASKIGEVFEVTSGATPLRSNKEFFKNANIPWVKTTDLNNAVITHTEEQISKVALKSTSVKMLPKGTVFVAMYGGFNQIGRTGLLANEATCNQALSAIYPNENIDSRFLLDYLNHNVKLWKSFAASSRKDPNITKGDVLAFPFNFPNIAEQTKIATFLSAVDTKIDELTQKHELLSEYKKGMMQQLFSQKLRFKGFSASWNDIKVGSLGTFNSGGTPSKKNSAYWKGDIPWISSSDLTEDSIFEVMTTRYITREAIDNSATKIIPKNSVLIVSRVGVGKVAVNSSQLCTSQDFTSLTPFEDNPVFLAYLLKSKASRLLEFNQGTSIKGFVRDDLINLSVSIPTKEEQTKIADFLTTIDQKIDNVAEQIDHAKTWKKGLLQQMFV
ncbi:restriction endonuclease subunit S [Psychrobacter sp. C 20.9]|uniref:restriction endonuclease subunit S n=1 Tax=Psychrobacter sp. C 20.9 TaxID=1926477 RepID=UPI0009468EDA|nr:restriction endonuclease subunit S [Psychrobacter sp. C 20.9]OLF34581.1 hypothetical protein BTW00_12895 [Psychrobacter sp. C 20.9]